MENLAYESLYGATLARYNRFWMDPAAKPRAAGVDKQEQQLRYWANVLCTRLKYWAYVLRTRLKYWAYVLPGADKREQQLRSDKGTF
jgi:hypothetical protein